MDFSRSGIIFGENRKNCKFSGSGHKDYTARTYPLNGFLNGFGKKWEAGGERPKNMLLIFSNLK